MSVYAGLVGVILKSGGFLCRRNTGKTPNHLLKKRRGRRAFLVVQAAFRKNVLVCHLGVCNVQNTVAMQRKPKGRVCVDPAKLDAVMTLARAAMGDEDTARKLVWEDE